MGAAAPRKSHLLTSIKSSEQGRKVVFFDSESRLDEDNKHYPYLICATFARYDLKDPYTKKVYLDNKFNKFYPNLNKFWGHVDTFTKRGESITIYSHNAFYDMVITQAIPELTRLGYRVMSFFEKGLTFFLKMQQTEPDPKRPGKQKVIKTLDFISTTNYFSTSLGKLADTLGLPEKLEYDYQNGSIDDAIIYCKRDVEIIQLAMEHFRKMLVEEDLGPLKPTIAGQAFAAYRHQFMNKDIFIHNNDKATELERKAYFGGRVECFKVGTFEGNFFKLDINSMYPYVMHEFKYPTKLISYRKKGTIQSLKKLIKNGYGVIANVTLKTDYANLPYRSAKKLIFPTGEFTAALATPELEYCLKFNLITEVHELSLYQMDSIFIDYVDYFYSKRMAAKAAGQDVYVALYKLFLNSLYGKFGQRSESWERIGDAEPDKVQVMTVQEKDGTHTTYKIFGGSIFKRVQEQESFNSFCAIATHVTSYARMLLAGFMDIADRDNLYYCDTDSLFTNEAGYTRLLDKGFIDNKELGKLKLEETGTAMEIYAPKDYSFGGHAKIKGIKKDAVILPSDEDGLLKFSGLQWPRLNGLLHTGQLSAYQNKTVIKKLARVYNGGYIDTSGNVLPFKIKNDTILSFEDTYSKNLFNAL